MTIDSVRQKSIFLAASELSDPAHREGYLDLQCGSDAKLRARVEALLRAHNGAESIDIQPSGPDFAATIDTSEIVRSDSVIAGAAETRLVYARRTRLDRA